MKLASGNADDVVPCQIADFDKSMERVDNVPPPMLEQNDEEMQHEDESDKNKLCNENKIIDKNASVKQR